MAKKLDITGNKYGTLTAICETEMNSRGQSKWLFICDCGQEYIARKSHIISGEMTCCKSCQRLQAKIKATQHGLTYDENGDKCKIFQAYLNIKKRCYDPNNPMFKNYGAKGITMQQSWLDDPKLFVDYMGKAPSREYSIERLDRFRGYEEGNVVWAKPTTQS